MILAHKIRLDVTEKQASYFARAAGTSRMVWNWALAEWNRQYAAGGSPSGLSLKKEFNAIKYELFPWLVDVHRDAHSAPFFKLQKAFNRFFNKTAKRPKFKKKGRAKDSFSVANDKLKVDGKRVRLPVIGWIRMREAIRFSGRILAATVNRTADHWYVAFQFEINEICCDRPSGECIGVDLGIKSLATLSDGRVFESPRPLRKFLSKLKKLQRRLARQLIGSNRRKRLAERIAKLHARIRNIRHDCLHKLTTSLCRENQAVVIENLYVKGMLQNRKVSQAISDSGFAEIRRQLKYKAERFGVRVFVVERWYPSSKTCSNCRAVKDSLSLSERVFKCSSCGFEIDRDLNAAKNLHTVGLTEIYARGPEGPGVCYIAGAKPCRVEARTKPRANLLAN